MKIALINTFETSGGAAIACKRIMKALQKAEIDVKLIVRDKTSNDPSVISVNNSFVKRKINFVRFCWERLIIFISNHFNYKKLFLVSIANTGSNISQLPEIKEADIIHIHWINQGFLSLKDIKCFVETGKPIVWTMHDLWACTGICHYAYKCEEYKRKCGNCSFLNSNKSNDLSNKIWKKKQFLNTSGINIVTVSSWLEGIVNESSLTKMLSTTVIPNVIDTDIFKPYDKKISRKIFALPDDKKILLMGAARLDDYIKGGHFLQQALQYFSKREDILLVLFGNIKSEKSFVDNLSVKYIHLGLIKDASEIAKLYSAADVTICPSLYETFGQTISESMACGCPVVSFNNSGQTDIINHKQNGYLAKSEDIDDLAKGIEWVLNNADTEQLSIKAREKATNTYNENVIAKQYIELFEKIINKQNVSSNSKCNFSVSSY